MESGFDRVYCDPKTGVLRNRLGITDKERLEIEEAKISSALAKEIRAMPFIRADMDIAFFKDLHRTLLGDVFDWAGEYRRSDIGITFDHTSYIPWQTVPEKTEGVFEYIKKHTGFKSHPYGKKIAQLALVFGCLKNFQPFRDGNTRTSLLFTSILGSNCGVALDWSLLDTHQFGLAQVKARDNDFQMLIYQFAGISFPLEERPELRYPKALPSNGRTILQQLEDMKKARSAWQDEKSATQKKKYLER